jgi:hypothetical protein
MFSRFDRQYRVTADTVITPEWWNRIFREIDARLVGLEEQRATLGEYEEQLVGIALQRINEALLPAYEQIARLANLGALFAAQSETEATIGTGVRVFTVAPSQRETFAPVPFLVAAAGGDFGQSMVGRLSSYDVATGVLTMVADAAYGSGTYSDWTIGPVASTDDISELRAATEAAAAAATAAATTTAADLSAFQSVWYGARATPPTGAALGAQYLDTSVTPAVIRVLTPTGWANGFIALDLADSAQVTGVLPVNRGGTGATTANDARTNLGLGTVATQNTVPVANGGTGATSASGARSNLGVVPTASPTDNTAGRLLKVADSANLLSASPSRRMTVGGTANAITLQTGPSPVFTGTPPTGLQLRFRATAANTGATTIALDGGTPIACRTVTGAALPAGYIRAGAAGDGYFETVVVYDGSHWIVLPSVEIAPGGTGRTLALAVESVSTSSNTYDTQATSATLEPGLWHVSLHAGVLGTVPGRVRVIRTDTSATLMEIAPGFDVFTPALGRSAYIDLPAATTVQLQASRTATSGTATIRTIRLDGRWIRDL